MVTLQLSRHVSSIGVNPLDINNSALGATGASSLLKAQHVAPCLGHQESEHTTQSSDGEISSTHRVVALETECSSTVSIVG